MIISKLQKETNQYSQYSTGWSYSSELCNHNSVKVTT